MDRLVDRNYNVNESSDMSKTINDIAKKEFDISTLKTRNSDSKDFYSLSVWQLKSALESAYAAGKKEQ